MEELVCELRRANLLKERELRLMLAEINAKENELQLQILIKQKEEIALKQSQSKNESRVATTAQDKLKNSFIKHFLMGLFVTGVIMGEGIRRHLPDWIIDVKDTCAAEFNKAVKSAADAAAGETENKNKCSFWSYLKFWETKVTNAEPPEWVQQSRALVVRYSDYSLCMAQGSLSIIASGLLCLVMLYIFKKGFQFSNSKRGLMPVTLFLAMGSVMGLIGKEVVDLMEGNGFGWLLLWMVFCLVHASIQLFTDVYIWLFRKSRTLKVMFNVAVVVMIPLCMGVVALPFGV